MLRKLKKQNYRYDKSTLSLFARIHLHNEKSHVSMKKNKVKWFLVILFFVHRKDIRYHTIYQKRFLRQDKKQKKQKKT